MKSAIASQKRRAFLLAAVAFGAAGAACGSDSADPLLTSTAPAAPTPSPVVACTAQGFHPIEVEVKDAATGKAVFGATGTTVHTDGTSVPLQPATQQSTNVLAGGILGRWGYWTVTVRATGYSDWSIDGVGTPFTTTEDPCPRSHRLTANLVRST